MCNIIERNSNCKLRSLSLNTAYIYSAVMLQNNTLCYGKAKAGASDFPRPGFIDTIESLVDLVEGILRNTYAGVLYAYIEIVGIRIDRDKDFSVIPVILDGVLNKVRDDHDHLDFVDLRVNLSHTDHCQFDVSFLRDWSKPSKDHLDHLVDIALLDIETGVFPVHTNKGEQFRYDLVFAVHLIFDIDHELPVHLNRHIFLLHQGICQNFH